MTELVCVKDFEKYAESVLSKNALDYYRSGAGQETTLKNNRDAFSKYNITLIFWLLMVFLHKLFID